MDALVCMLYIWLKEYVVATHNEWNSWIHIDPLDGVVNSVLFWPVSIMWNWCVDMLVLDLMILNSKAFLCICALEGIGQKSQSSHIYFKFQLDWCISVLVLGLSPYEIASAVDRLNYNSYATYTLLLSLLCSWSSCFFPHLWVVPARLLIYVKCWWFWLFVYC